MDIPTYFVPTMGVTFVNKNGEIKGGSTFSPEKVRFMEAKRDEVNPSKNLSGPQTIKFEESNLSPKLSGVPDLPASIF
jgi:hypothetical protein